MAVHPGDAVRVEMTKWVDRPHWSFDARHLGSDEHGDWIGIRTGTTMSRPGATFVAATDQVGLVPPDAGWLATFHAPGFRIATYVDITTVPRWDGAVVRAVDLDLDVVRTAEGVVYVDDEDEFAEHQLSHGYPAEVVTAAEESCAWVLAQVRREHPPFDGGSADRWLDRLAGRAGW